MTGQILVKTYKGNQREAANQFQWDAEAMAKLGYSPVAQSYAQGQWGAGAYVVALLLILLFGLGILILGYLLVVKPAGTLTVTYRHV